MSELGFSVFFDVFFLFLHGLSNFKRAFRYPANFETIRRSVGVVLNVKLLEFDFIFYKNVDLKNM